MKSNSVAFRAFCFLACAALIISLGTMALAGAPQIASDQKATVTGTIVSRNGDLVKVTGQKLSDRAIEAREVEVDD